MTDTFFTAMVERENAASATEKVPLAMFSTSSSLIPQNTVLERDVCSVPYFRTLGQNSDF